MENSLLLLVGTYTQNLGHVPEGKGKGIHFLSFNFENKENKKNIIMKQVGVVGVKGREGGEGGEGGVENNPTYLVLTKGEKGEKGEKEGEFVCVCENEEGKVFLVNFWREEGKVKWKIVSEKSTKGAYPCHVSTDTQKRMIVTSNYSNDQQGSVCAYERKEGGKGEGEGGVLGSLAGFVQFEEGGSVNLERQLGSHLHQAIFSPCNNYVVTCDLGKDRVSLFTAQYPSPSSPPSLSPHPSSPHFSLPVKGSGPRHLVFHPSLPLFYLLSELSNTVSILSFDPSQNSPISHLSTYSLFPSFSLSSSSSSPPPSSTTAAAIKINKAGTTLYLTTRGSPSPPPSTNLLFSLRLSSDGKTITELSRTETEEEKEGERKGGCPRDFILSPCEQIIVVASQNSHKIVGYLVGEGGEVGEKVGEVEVGAPVCLAFA